MIIAKIQDIRVKPQLHLAKATFPLLKAFIDGYAIREYELNGDAECVILDDFQTFVEEHYQEKLALNWASIIQKHSESDKEAFSKFFELFDEYIKSTQVL